jgi:hypothetical protein
VVVVLVVAVAASSVGLVIIIKRELTANSAVYIYIYCTICSLWKFNTFSREF